MPTDLGHPHRPASPITIDDSTYSRYRNCHDCLRGIASGKKDKNFRRYASAVERALSLFDTALQEWADYISFLGRLSKALQSKPPGVNEVPNSGLVAKRLSQCLSPMLPSGVHQKALEVYGIVFAILGKDGLTKELPLYLPGLSPLLSFASLSVKPALLSLFESSIINLDLSTLQPALKAIVLALLPGLEEEGSEEFDRTHALLDKLKNAVGKSDTRVIDQAGVTNQRYFWQSLFLATITSTSRRQGALAYLERNLPRLGETPSRVPEYTSLNGSEINSGKIQLPFEVEAVVSPEPGLLIRCIAAGLQDQQLLIQRGFLDLLVTHLPLNSVVLKRQIVAEDLELLVSAAASVVARREMSLNRRLWVWFLGQAATTDTEGSEPNSPESVGIRTANKAHRDSPTRYFEQHGLSPLISILLKMFNNSSSTPTVKARPFRICLSLMDRWEIGGLVIPRIFRSAIESMHQYGKDAPSQDSFSEVLRSASVFFDGVQSRVIWKELLSILFEAFDLQAINRGDREFEQVQRQVDLVWFTITKFDIREEEMLSIHLPNALILLLISIRNLSGTGIQLKNMEMPGLLQSAYKVSNFLLDLIPQRAFIKSEAQGEHSAAIDDSQYNAAEEKDTLTYIQDIYKELDQNDSSKVYQFRNLNLGSRLVPIATDLVQKSLQNAERPAFLEAQLSLLTKLVKKTQNSQPLNVAAVLSGLAQAVKTNGERLGDDASFPQIYGLSIALELVNDVTSPRDWCSNRDVREIITEMVVCLWAYISPERPRHSVEAVRCLWRMQHISPDNQLVESAIASLMLQGPDQGDESITIDGARRFATLWTHSISTSSTVPEPRIGPTRTDSQTDRRIDKSRCDPDILRRPLLLLLENLKNSKSQLFMFTSVWLQSLPNLLAILKLLTRLLHDSPYLVHLRWEASHSSTTKAPVKNELNGAEESVYFVETIHNILMLRSPQVHASLKDPISISTSMNEGMNMTGTSGPSMRAPEDPPPTLTIQAYLVQVCMMIFQQYISDDYGLNQGIQLLSSASSSLLQIMLPDLEPAFSGIVDLEALLIKTLCWAVEHAEIGLQPPLMDCLGLIFRKRLLAAEPSATGNGRSGSKEYRRNVSQISLPTERSDKDQPLTTPASPDPAVLGCLILGLSSPKSRSILEQWVGFLGNCLPLYTGSTFHVMLPLVGCVCRSIEAVFQAVQETFEKPSMEVSSECEPVRTLNTLFKALEQVLAKGHDQITNDEAKSSSIKSPEPVQGFFGSMVSALSAEAQAARSATANNHLTVLLCFKDTVKVSLKLWSWGDEKRDILSHDATTSSSFNYTSVRLRNRSRRVLESLFAAEPLECLETLVDAWQSASSKSTSIMNLLHTLEAARPKNSMPAIFNAIYSRTNPQVLDPARKSSLTSELSDVQLAAFLVAYTKSMDDDALDEVWYDCLTFSRDVLGNPLPHRQTLPLLLEFIAILGEKIDNTNFAMFTIKPLAFPPDLPAIPEGEHQPREDLQSASPRNADISNDVVAIVASTLPKMSKLLIETDRIATAAATISAQILLPTFHWKTFPHNVTFHTLEIVQCMSRIAEASKTWRKDVAEAFNDPKFFATTSPSLIERSWMSILRQWVLLDKERFLEILSRLPAPTAAGIMFGVGASSARLEADRKAQLNLRRIALLVLSTDDDSFVANINGIQEKIAELLSATASSSPSSVTRAETYMVLRALILKNEPVHLASLWPIINTELYEALSSIAQIASRETYNITCILQAAKLLDTLLIVAPDDFQLREWLYITDTIDAVYRPLNWRPVALVDELAETLDNEASILPSANAPFADEKRGVRKPLLRWDLTKGVARENLMDHVLRPFLRQLSINAFESTYRMETADRKACCEELLRDLFDDKTLV
ncbi:MAG: hypothetical protein Q9163_003216 [Psora crenata]